jgi:hypothetical protein
MLVMQMDSGSQADKAPVRCRCRRRRLLALRCPDLVALIRSCDSGSARARERERILDNSSEIGDVLPAQWGKQ